MTEKEKMINGLLYNANETQLVDDRNKVKDLCHAFNHLLPSAAGKQQEIIKQIFGSIKDGFVVLPPFWCDYGYNIEAGENFYVNHDSMFLDCAKITFGNNVFIAPNCNFITAGQPVDAAQRNSGAEFARPITVGNDVWFGAGVIVLPGVTIGNNVVIGAGSVVTKSIPDGVFAVGNPCKVLRKITENDKIR